MGSAKHTYSKVPTGESTLEEEEARVAEDEEMQIWIQESMAQVAALQQYGVICIVLSGFAFSGLVSFDHKQIKEDMNYTVYGVHVGHGLVFCLTLSMAICVSCGIYGTLIFTLCSIYGAVAVSHGDQNGFVSFMSRTGKIRTWAFVAFKGALLSMLSSIVLILLTIIPLGYAVAVVIPSLVIAVGGVCHAGKVMTFAQAEFGHSSLAQYHKHGTDAIGNPEGAGDESGDSDEEDPII